MPSNSSHSFFLKTNTLNIRNEMCDAYVGPEWEAGTREGTPSLLENSWNNKACLLLLFHRAAARVIPSNAILVRPAIGKIDGEDKPRKRARKPRDRTTRRRSPVNSIRGRTNWSPHVESYTRFRPHLFYFCANGRYFLKLKRKRAGNLRGGSSFTSSLCWKIIWNG